MSREMDQYLKGSPSKLLIRKVRRHLKGYGIIPTAKHWRLAWEWAALVANSYQCDDMMIGQFKARRPRWPSPSEIGAQYLALVLAEMRDMHALKLPYRAVDRCPIAARVALAPAYPQAEPKQLTAAEAASCH